jgi:hypothetical protein
MSERSIIVQRALDGHETLSRDVVAEWCRMAGDDVEALAALYRLTYEAHERIQPPLERDESCGLIRRYLLECLRSDPDLDGVLRRYDAAQVLLRWFWHLSRMPDTASVLEDTAAAVTELYLTGDAAVREVIETGFLEHLLEDEEYRPLFGGWAQRDELRDAWECALAWGKAHPGFTRSLLERTTGE